MHLAQQKPTQAAQATSQPQVSNETACLACQTHIAHLYDERNSSVGHPVKNMLRQMWIMDDVLFQLWQLPLRASQNSQTYCRDQVSACATLHHMYRFQKPA